MAAEHHGWNYWEGQVDLPPGYQPDGEDMLSSLHGKPITRTKPIYWEWRGTNKEPNWWPRLAVRDGDWKLLMTYDKKRTELYHVADDRAEARDVAAEHCDIVAKLSALATQWKASLPKEPPAGCSSRVSDRKAQKKPAPRK